MTRTELAEKVKDISAELVEMTKGGPNMFLDQWIRDELTAFGEECISRERERAVRIVERWNFGTYKQVAQELRDAE